MGAMFRMGKAGQNSTHVLRFGEVALQEMPDGSVRTIVGDGKTGATELPSFLPYDLHERVRRLEQEMESMKKPPEVK